MITFQLFQEHQSSYRKLEISQCNYDDGNADYLQRNNGFELNMEILIITLPFRRYQDRIIILNFDKLFIDRKWSEPNKIKMDRNRYIK